jgi:hypothetical protein
MNNNYITVSNAIYKSVDNFIYYDRKEDEDLSVMDLKNFIENGDISIKEIKDLFCHALERGLEQYEK